MVEARRKALGLFLVALVLTGMAAVTFTRRVRAWEAAVGPEVQVVAAAEDLPAGVPLTKKMLTVTTVPKRVAARLVTKQPASLEGQALVLSLRKGDLITPAMLRAAAPLSPDERIITLKNGGNVAIEAGVVANSLVDIIAFHRVNNQDTSEMVLSGLRVASVDQTNRGYVIRVVVSHEQLIKLVQLENTARQLRVIKRDGLL